MTKKFLIYGAVTGAVVSFLLLLLWGVLFYLRGETTTQSLGLEAAIFLLSSLVSFPLSLAVMETLDEIDYPVVLVRLAIILGPVVNWALYGLVFGAVWDTRPVDQKPLEESSGSIAGMAQCICCVGGTYSGGS